MNYKNEKILEVLYNYDKTFGWGKILLYSGGARYCSCDFVGDHFFINNIPMLHYSDDLYIFDFTDLYRSIRFYLSELSIKKKKN